jgi:hypothetical protein
VARYRQRTCQSLNRPSIPTLEDLAAQPELNKTVAENKSSGVV